LSDTAEDVTEEQKLAWLRGRRNDRATLPTGPLTAEAWRCLILRQITADPTSLSRILGVAQWALVTSVDLDAIEELIRCIAVYGVLEEPDDGGSGPNEEVPRAGDDVQGEGDCRTC
jgi:hypothetical protein